MKTPGKDTIASTAKNGVRSGTVYNWSASLLLMWYDLILSSLNDLEIWFNKETIDTILKTWKDTIASYLQPRMVSEVGLFTTDRYPYNWCDVIWYGFEWMTQKFDPTKRDTIETMWNISLKEFYKPILKRQFVSLDCCQKWDCNWSRSWS